MPAPAVYGLGSGQDHTKTIEKLMSLERIPIRRMERQNQRMEYTIKAWNEAQGRARKLADKSRMLFSFLGPFANKSILASDPGAITGRATSSVESGTHHIEVIELALRHQVHSNRLQIEEALPAATFTVTVGNLKQPFSFGGGKPADLERLLREKGSDLFDVVRVQTDASSVLLGLRSKKMGRAGQLSFSDPDGLLQKVGLAKAASGERETKSLSILAEELSTTTNPKQGSGGSKTGEAEGSGPKKKSGESKKQPAAGQSPSGSHEILSNGTALRVDGALRVRVGRPIAAQAKVTLAVELAGQGAGPGTQQVQESVAGGPGIEVRVGEVKLHGYEVERSRTTMQPKSASGRAPQARVHLTWMEGKVEKRHTIEVTKHRGNVELDVGALTGGRQALALELEAGPGARAIFRNLRVDAPKDVGGGLAPVHETSAARDARLRVEGVEITRPTNTDITDLIRGASLNLRKTTSGPIDVKVFADADEIIKRIKEWVQAYNDLVKFCRDNSKAAAPKELASSRAADGDLEKSMDSVRDSSGIFASDATIRSLVHSMQRITSEAYPAPEKPGFRVLSDIGISTGDVGIGNFRNNRYGLLDLDEKKLREALDTSAEGVKQLFASDNNSDARIDNGAAHRMHETLKPYSTTSGGMIGVRIQLLNDRIADNKKRISNKELSLKSVEERLRRKFGGMETYMRRSRATGDFLRNRLRMGGSE